MAQLAIWLLIAFGVLTFGVRVAIQLRRTGKTGLIGVREGAGAADWASGILFVAGMAIGVASPILVLGDHLEPIGALDVDAAARHRHRARGGGGLAVFAAQLGMGESWRIGVSDEERTDLITGGWFSLPQSDLHVDDRRLAGPRPDRADLARIRGGRRDHARAGASGALRRGALPPTDTWR